MKQVLILIHISQTILFQNYEVLWQWPRVQDASEKQGNARSPNEIGPINGSEQRLLYKIKLIKNLSNIPLNSSD